MSRYGAVSSVGAKCACKRPSSVVIMVQVKAETKAFGFCDTHLRQVLDNDELVAALIGHAMVLEPFSAATALRLAEAFP